MLLLVPPTTAALTAHFAGASVVFHLASAGMSGAQQLQRRLVESVNVGGTRAVLGAAAAAAVGRLIYLSTYNVVYCGQLIEGGDEALPPCPPDAHCDAYSRTKALAEAAVLAADGTPMPGRPGRRLRTCALRPAGIWGPGEQRHLPRIVRYLEMGLFCFTIGGPDDAVVDWVHVSCGRLGGADCLAERPVAAMQALHAAGMPSPLRACPAPLPSPRLPQVDNLVQAMCLAAAALTPEKRCVAGGQASRWLSSGWCDLGQ